MVCCWYGLGWMNRGSVRLARRVGDQIYDAQPVRIVPVEEYDENVEPPLSATLPRARQQRRRQQNTIETSVASNGQLRSRPVVAPITESVLATTIPRHEAPPLAPHAPPSPVLVSHCSLCLYLYATLCHVDMSMLIESPKIGYEASLSISVNLRWWLCSMVSSTQ
jgi:hypothetical protein